MIVSSRPLCYAVVKNGAHSATKVDYLALYELAEHLTANRDKTQRQILTNYKLSDHKDAIER